MSLGAATESGVPLRARQGTVVEFDDPRGLGVVRADDGFDYPFHCTAVADGSRTITVGTAVSFRVVAGRLGRWEAGGVAAASDCERGADHAPQ